MFVSIGQLLNCLCQMMSHDYHMIINSAKQGTCIAIFLNDIYERYDWIFF